MLGLEPGDEGTVLASSRHGPEADEGRHLVEVAPHRARHRLRPGDIGIDAVVEQRRLLLQAQQHAVEQGEAATVPVADHRLGQIKEAPGHREIARLRLRRCQRIPGSKQAAPAFAPIPFHVLGRCARLRQPARLGTPACEVGGP